MHNINYTEDGEYQAPPVTKFFVDGYAGYRGVFYYSVNGTLTANGNRCPNPTLLVAGRLKLLMKY